MEEARGDSGEAPPAPSGPPRGVPAATWPLLCTSSPSRVSPLPAGLPLVGGSWDAWLCAWPNGDSREGMAVGAPLLLRAMTAEGGEADPARQGGEARACNV